MMRPPQIRGRKTVRDRTAAHRGTAGSSMTAVSRRRAGRRRCALLGHVPRATGRLRCHHAGRGRGEEARRMTSHDERAAAAFSTAITSVGPVRQPRQLLDDQSIGGHASIHDEATAGSLGLSGAPIEAPTHFSPVRPAGVRAAGAGAGSRPAASAPTSPRWWSRARTSRRPSPRRAAPRSPPSRPPSPTAASSSPAPLRSTATAETELGRRARIQPATPASCSSSISSRWACDRRPPCSASVDHDTPNGALYPFSLAQKLEAITEPSPWYSSDDNPWGRRSSRSR